MTLKYFAKSPLRLLVVGLLLMVGFLFFSPGAVSAINDSTTAGGTTGGSCEDGTTDPALCSACNKDGQPDQDCNLTKKYLNPIINKFLAPLAILAVIIGIIWGSIEFATSAGDAQKAASGKGKIQKALIGLLAFIFLYAFLSWLMPGGLGA